MRALVIAATVYIAGALATFGPAAVAREDFCAGRVLPSDCQGAGALIAAIFWPFWWSWELAE